MDRTFRHVLITRFNVEISYASPGRGIEDDWLRNRIEVFDRITVPSVQSQTAPLDAWMVFLNAQSPAWFRANIEEREYLTPVWIDGPLLDGRIPEELAALGFADREFLITSRVDNDDALSRDYVATVQRQFARQERLFVEFPNGIEYANGDYYRKRWRSNPFLSLIERTGPQVDTVICRPHTEVRRAEPTLTLWDHEMWMQNSHPLSATSPRVRNVHPIFRRRRPEGIICHWEDDGGSMRRRLGIAIRSVPHSARLTAYRILRRVD
ncbi:glycosyltransferase [Microbacterium sp. MAHUQ-60]|uniref:glycosyltransferase n=1 Tax=unclassified Microbacterium TaxID=2609290 RepID=UPI00360FD162